MYSSTRGVSGVCYQLDTYKIMRISVKAAVVSHVKCTTWIPYRLSQGGVGGTM